MASNVDNLEGGLLSLCGESNGKPSQLDNIKISQVSPYSLYLRTPLARTVPPVQAYLGDAGFQTTTIK